MGSASKLWEKWRGGIAGSSSSSAFAVDGFSVSTAESLMLTLLPVATMLLVCTAACFDRQSQDWMVHKPIEKRQGEL